MNNTTFLNEIQLEKIAPSVFAMQKGSKTSDKYGFIPTINVVRGLKDVGFFPVQAKQSNSRSEDNKSYSKHLIRFRQENAQPIDGLYPEIVLVNSHNGSTSYQLRAGIYRMVCTNGLIVGNDLFCRRVRHQGDVISNVVEGASQLLEIFPKSIEIAKEWQGIKISPQQQIAYAEAAATLKWQEDEIPVDAKQLVSPRRGADTAPDVWTTFNVVQENLIKGGQRYRTENGRRQRTREVSSVGENTRLNTALWKLTERLAECAR